MAKVPSLTLKMLSLRYSSWSMRPWLVLSHSGLEFNTETVSLPHMMDPAKTTTMVERRKLGSVRGLFPVLQVSLENQDDKEDSTVVHESLAICEYIADLVPEAHLWPKHAVDRAKARAICCEMMTSFTSLRNECSCSLFARVPDFEPTPQTREDIHRVFEIWSECLAHSGGPFLFGEYFGIADAMYFPVITRFRTYGIAITDPKVKAYVEAIEALPVVKKLLQVAKKEPPIPVYDEYIRKLGGDPNQELHG